MLALVDSGRSPSATNLDPWKERLAGFPCRQLIHKQPAFLAFPSLSSHHHLAHSTQDKKVFFTFHSLFININNHSRLGSIFHHHSRFKSTSHLLQLLILQTSIIPSSLAMPSIQKILIVLAFAASAFAQTEIADGQIQQITDGQIQEPTAAPAVVKQITDGQIQQVTSTSTPVVTPAVKQITDGQIQQVTSTPVVTPAVKQITDGQIQQVTSTPVVTPAVKQITDGQIQQVTSTPVVTPAVKQITDGQIQQVTSTPVVTPAVKQITDGQIQQVSASIVTSVHVNATSVTTPSAPAATFTGAASLMSYSNELAAVALGAGAVFAML